jgi:hypothetical protein
MGGMGGEGPSPTICTKDCCGDALAQITVTGEGESINGNAHRPYLSGDGTWLTFTSSATNLTDEMASGQDEVYLYSLASKRFHLVSRAPSGELADGASSTNEISEDGRWVLFTSWATNLAPDANGLRDVFLYDRDTSEILLVSATSDGSAGNGASWGRDLSPDGRYAVFSSSASNLTPGDDNDAWDVFVWDRLTRTTQRVSMGPGDQQTNPISGNHAHISADGRFVSFHSLSSQLDPSDENPNFDIFLADLQRGTTTRVSTSADGRAPNGNVFVLGMSDDARFFSSYSSASNLISDDKNDTQDVFLFDRKSIGPARVNVGASGQEADAGSSNAVLSASGRYVTFSSRASNLVMAARGTFENSFLFDTQSSSLTLLSQGPEGVPANGDSDVAHVTRSGGCYVFASRANNLSTDSTNDQLMDLFVGPLP